MQRESSGTTEPNLKIRSLIERYTIPVRYRLHLIFDENKLRGVNNGLFGIFDTEMEFFFYWFMGFLGDSVEKITVVTGKKVPFLKKIKKINKKKF